MPRKTRRHRKSSSSPSLFSWPRVLIVVLPLLVAIFIFTNNQNARNVLGISDTNFFNLSSLQNSTSSAKRANRDEARCKPNRISAFSVTGLCDQGKQSFKSASYTCEDSTTGTLVNTSTKGCFNVQSAFERAQKACAKNSKCAKVEKNRKLSPKPTHPEPTRAEPTEAESGL